jgi:hypothetical protein
MRSKEGKVIGCHITVPRSVGLKLEEQNKLLECEVTEDGLLYRPVEALDGEEPEWLK